MAGEQEEIRKDYTNGFLIIHWRPALCEKCGACHQGMPEVFKPDERPWIQANGADTQELINQIDSCPTGALTYT